MSALLLGWLGCLAGPSAAAPASGDLGVGLGGDAFGVGLSARLQASQERALQFLLTGGFHTFEDDRYSLLAFGGDYLFERPVFYREADYEVNWYLGPGARVGLMGDPDAPPVLVGVSGVGGVKFTLTGAPLILSLEARPTLVLYSDAQGFAVRPIRFGGHIHYTL